MKEKLIKWYVEEELSRYQIAEILDCSTTKVKSLMKEYGIKPRSRSECQKVNKRNPWKDKTEQHKKRIAESVKKSWNDNPNQGMSGKHHSEETKRKISESQITTGESKNAREYKKLANELFDGKCLKCSTVKDLCVHHKDGDHYNNKPENLELLCRSCHLSVHRKNQYNGNNVESGIPRGLPKSIQ